MRRKIFSSIMVVLIILAIFYISIPMSIAEKNSETITNKIEIQFNKIRRKEIMVEEGEIE